MDPGGTDYNPQTGIRDRWAIAAPAVPERPKVEFRTITMLDVFERWNFAECDLHEVFGIDVEDRVLMRERSWRWLELRLTDLIDRGPRLSLALRTAS